MWVKKSRIYLGVVIAVGLLLLVRIYNAWLSSRLSEQILFREGSSQLRVIYPQVIPGPQLQAKYPLTFIFSAKEPRSSNLEIILSSSTLRFENEQNEPAPSRLIIPSDTLYFSVRLYLRPLIHPYPQSYEVVVRVMTPQLTESRISISTKPGWYSDLSLFINLFFVEISVALALIAWLIGAIDSFEKETTERARELKSTLKDLVSFPVLERIRQYNALQADITPLKNVLQQEIEHVRRSVSDQEIVRELGLRLRQQVQIGNVITISEANRLVEQWNSHFRTENSEKIFHLLKDLLAPSSKDTVSAFRNLMEVWDALDVNAKDLIVFLVEHLLQGPGYPISPEEKEKLSKEVFNTPSRRRLLRDENVRRLLPDLYPSEPAIARAPWFEPLPEPVSPVKSWLAHHDLITHPFGFGSQAIYPFYPPGCSLPENWKDFLEPQSQIGICPTEEDALALAYALRKEAWRRGIFPLLIDLSGIESEVPLLMVIGRILADHWIDILPLYPESLLDLNPPERQAILQLLCWSLGARESVIRLIQQRAEQFTRTHHLLCQQIAEYIIVPNEATPSPSVFLSWLAIRPALGMTSTYLFVFTRDSTSLALSSRWMREWHALVVVFRQYQIVVKMLQAKEDLQMALPTISLEWTLSQLRSSLKSQFDHALSLQVQGQKAVGFHELFGPYGISEEQTTERLILASQNSLARMLAMGHKLIENHCKQRGVQERFLYIEDFETLLSER